MEHSLKQYLRAVSKVLKKLRKAAQLSQEEAAARAGIDRSHLSDLEAGKHDPGTYRLILLAKVYGLTLEQMAALIEQHLAKK